MRSFKKDAPEDRFPQTIGEQGKLILMRKKSLVRDCSVNNWEERAVLPQHSLLSKNIYWEASTPTAIIMCCAYV